MHQIYVDFLNGPDIAALQLTNEDILGAIEASLAAQGRGQAVIEPRMHLKPDPAVHGHFNVLRGAIGGDVQRAGVKVVSDFVYNYERGLPSEMAVLTLFDPRTGMPQAILDAGGITDLLALAERLRDAQQRMAGDDLRSLSRERRGLVDRLARRAVELGRAAGWEPPDGAIQEVSQTLQAGMRFQQGIAELAIKGDEVLDALPAHRLRLDDRDHPAALGRREAQGGEVGLPQPADLGMGQATGPVPLDRRGADLGEDRAEPVRELFVAPARPGTPACIRLRQEHDFPIPAGCVRPIDELSSDPEPSTVQIDIFRRTV